MNNVNVNMQQVLDQIRAYSRVAEQRPDAQEVRTDFSQVFANSLNQVNGMQQHAISMRSAYEMGDPSLDLPEVMIAVQKASLAFEATTEIRNKFLNAYQEIMNMQV